MNAFGGKWKIEIVKELALRIQREIRAWCKIKFKLDRKWNVQYHSLIQIMPRGDELKVLIVFLPAFCDLKGMKHLKVQMEIAGSDPDLSPKFKFLTVMWHPDVRLEDWELVPEFNQHDWSISPSISSAVLAICSLIVCPEMEHATVQKVSQQFLMDRELFITNSLAWNKAFACSFPEKEADILKLGLMVARFENGRYPMARKDLVEELAKIKSITIQQESEWKMLSHLMSYFPSFRPGIRLSHLLGDSLQGVPVLELRLIKMIYQPTITVGDSTYHWGIGLDLDCLGSFERLLTRLSKAFNM